MKISPVISTNDSRSSEFCGLPFENIIPFKCWQKPAWWKNFTVNQTPWRIGSMFKSITCFRMNNLWISWTIHFYFDLWFYIMHINLKPNVLVLMSQIDEVNFQMTSFSEIIWQNLFNEILRRLPAKNRWNLKKKSIENSNCFTAQCIHIVFGMQIFDQT